MNIAALRLENTRFPEPGDRATAHLRPLTPTQWQHVRPGQHITLHEGRPTIATATLLDPKST
ncbi:hypothetical protein [Streptomyces yangpuensis]|uniref:hypothetical protein n=1 Tax=Streptomyces yangpuensis TaxID=1648182 RepID=UPI00371D85A7